MNIKIKREANFQTTFNHWVKNVYKNTAAFELKQTQTNSLPFSSVAPHQIQALLNIKNGVFVYKIVDCGYQNPMDSFCMVNEHAYLVVKYPKFWVLIDINDFVNEVKRSDRKSLTGERAKEISTLIVETSS